jgi:hypothetical protein
MRLIPNWKNAWKMASVVLAAVLAIASALQANSSDIQQLISPQAFYWFSTVMGLLVIVGRVVKQTGLLTTDIEGDSK